jgi:hypothetical protein
MILRAALLSVLSCLAAALPAALAPSPTAAREAAFDPTGPALVALAMRNGPRSLPTVAELLIGLPTARGAQTVCGRVTYQGAGGRFQRFVVVVDEEAMQHRQLAEIKLEQMPGFESDWVRHCRLGMS